MPIFADKQGVRHYIRQFVDVVEAPGGLEVGIICHIMASGQVYGVNVIGTLDSVVQQFRDEENALAIGWPTTGTTQ